MHSAPFLPLRALLAILLTIPVLPLLSLRLLPHHHPLLHPLHLLSHTLLTLLLRLSPLDLTLHPPTATASTAAALRPPPFLRRWSSPLPHARRIVTYDQPARWMSPADLRTLAADLHAVATASVGAVPAHRLFDAPPATALANRVVSVVYDQHGPLGFVAMVYLPVRGQVVVHLGLTMLAARAKGQRLQTTLFTRSLVVPVLTLRTTRYVVTNLAASPAGIGSVADYMYDTFPTYKPSAPRRPWHVLVARQVLTDFRHEFGCSTAAVFDEHTFVVRRSNAQEGGGTFQFIREDGDFVSRHRSEECNRFVRERVNASRGDELFQVAAVDLFGFARYALCGAWRKPVGKRASHEGGRGVVWWRG